MNMMNTCNLQKQENLHTRDVIQAKFSARPGPQIFLFGSARKIFVRPDPELMYYKIWTII